MRVILVGGGVMGLLSAYELVKAGCTVSLFDKSQTGTEASWAGGGIVSPLYPWRYGPSITALASWGQGYYPQLAETLANATGIDPEFNHCGLLMLDAEDEQEALRWAVANARNLVQETPANAYLLEPHLECPANSVVWMPEVGSLRNPRLLQALRLVLMKKSSFSLHVNEAVLALNREQGRVTGISTEKGRYNADAVVLSAGAWSTALLEKFDFALPVKPVRGQMVAIQADIGWLKHIVMKNGTYIVPRKDGLILAGSTLEFVGFDKTITTDARAMLLSRAYEMMPSLQRFPVIEQWAGLRPGSPDGIPFIGEMESVKGLFLNVGHYRNGLVLAPASCRLLADMMLRRPPIMDPLPYLPEPRLRAGASATLEWQ